MYNLQSRFVHEIQLLSELFEGEGKKDVKSSEFHFLDFKLTVAHVWAGDRQLSESSGKASRLVYSLPAQWSQSSIPLSKLTQPRSEHKRACS